jgi:lipid-A-disaccharide synthase
MKYFLIAGEASGDLHGAGLVRALGREDLMAECRCWGGDLMAAAGAQVTKHYRDLAFMGFVEVLKHLSAILENFRSCRQEILDFQPDALILIDYPGFNLRMARWASQRGIRVFYYISPQLWAWHSSRVNHVKRYVEIMYLILPFEIDFYRQFGVRSEFVGHPLLDVIEEHPQPNPGFYQRHGLAEDRPLVALLPGSRRQEISRMLPAMVRAAAAFPDHQFAVAGAPAMPAEFYRQWLPPDLDIPVLENQTYELLRHARAALVTSGTATLEAALFGVPQVVCYRGGKMSYLLARALVNKSLKFIALANLVAGNAIVPELLQDNMNSDSIVGELKLLLEPGTRERIKADYAGLRQLLGPPGAADRVAASLVKRLKG